jgi:apolipoprotein N-acyltransferase
MVIALIDISRDTRIRKRGLYGYGFFFFFCFYCVCFHWFVNLYPLDFIEGMTKLAAIAVVLLGCFELSALQALGAGVSFIIYAKISRREKFKDKIIFSALLFASMWAVLEWSQTIGWVGVPWARLAIGQAGLLLGTQSASLFGSAFVTFLIVFVNFTVAGALLLAEKRRLLSLVSVSLLLVNFLFGTISYFKNTENGESVTMAVVQGNVSSEDKWDSSHTEKTLEVYREYTKKAAIEGAEIVIWPETALPYNIDNIVSLRSYISGLARDNNVTLLVGAFTSDEDGEYNSIVTVLPDGSIHETVYSKRHLVPFGEYVPYRDFFEAVLPVLTDIGMLSYDLVPGDSSNVIELEEVNVGSLICFDSIYDELARESVISGAEVLAISTNDSWFSDSAALNMHNAQAALRSIENGRYTVRAANTGISSAIAPNGKMLDSIPALREGCLVIDVYPCEHRTLYSYIGNTFVYICIVWLVFCCFGEITLKTVKKMLHD